MVLTAQELNNIAEELCQHLCETARTPSAVPTTLMQNIRAGIRDVYNDWYPRYEQVIMMRECGGYHGWMTDDEADAFFDACLRGIRRIQSGPGTMVDRADDEGETYQPLDQMMNPTLRAVNGDGRVSGSRSSRNTIDMMAVLRAANRRGEPMYKRGVNRLRGINDLRSTEGGSEWTSL